MAENLVARINDLFVVMLDKVYKMEARGETAIWYRALNIALDLSINRRGAESALPAGDE